ncbi:hypothetical protein [Sphingobacterium sp. LRF_L2]|uniref:hypothetical protein n=1 Tax=Sphingobacterium sp. LRF_L2 TaxID=3369421 RepID=UPI003F607214
MKRNILSVLMPILLIIVFFNTCELATRLRGAEHIPTDYIDGLKLESAEIRGAGVVVPKSGRPAVDLIYKNKYYLFVFAFDEQVSSKLLPTLKFEESRKIGLTPNISYTGVGGYVHANFPISYPHLLKEPFSIILEPNSKKELRILNDSTTLVLLKDSRGFNIRNESKDYDGIVFKLQENEYMESVGHVDVGILVYHRQKRFYLVVVSGKNSNKSLLSFDELCTDFKI